MSRISGGYHHGKRTKSEERSQEKARQNNERKKGRQIREEKESLIN
jgi:hypothetical protein